MMTHEEFKQAREELGLTLVELARLVGLEGGDCRRLMVRYETPPDEPGHRPVPKVLGTFLRVLVASPEARRAAMRLRRDVLMMGDGQ